VKDEAPDGRPQAEAPSGGDYRRLFESNPQPMWVYDLETLRFLAVNQATVDRYGYSRDELLGMTIKDIRPLEDVPALLANVAAVGTHGSVTGGWRHRKKDGSLLDVEIASQPLSFAGRRAELVVPFDVTDRQRAETELLRARRAVEQSERQFRTLIENASDVITEVDRQGTIRYISPAVTSILGYKPGELEGRSAFDLIHPEDLPTALTRMAHRFANPDDATPTEFRFRHRDGRWRLLQSRATVLQEGSSAPEMVITARDVTEIKELEVRLHEAEKMEAIGRLAGGVAHDFNNLLTAVIGNSDLALAGTGPTDPMRHLLEEVKTAAERAAALTAQLLAFGRKQMATPQVLDLAAIAGDLTRMLRRLLPESVELATVIGTGAGRVNADRSQLEQVLMNLVLNARDAMPEGGRITLEIGDVDLDEAFAHQHSEVQPGPQVMLAVADTGSGMDEETQQHVFEPFFTTKELGRGTGLGLATVHGIVKQNRGSIVVESEAGRGTTFRVYLPRVEAAGGREEAKPAPAELPGGSELILLLEDDDAVRGMVHRVLVAHGYRVLDAGSGAEAESLFRESQQRVHMILTDVAMPSMNGPELVARLHRLAPDLPVLYMSGHADEAIVSSGVLANSETFLPKPFTPGSLIGKVRGVLDRAAERRGQGA